MKVIEAEYDLILRAFESEDLDMIICEKPVYDLEGKVKLFKIFGSTFVVVCSPEYKSAKRDFPECLSKLPFMNYTNRTSVQSQIMEYFFKNSINPQIIGEIDDVNIIRRFTVNGHCFSILPSSVIEETIKAGKLVVLSEVEDIEIVIHAIVRNKPQNESIFKILEELQKKG
jgi:LysR family transcriptional regulator, transcriptional activator of nhaA